MEIDMSKVERIWKAERELQDAIGDAAKHGILVDVIIDEFVSGMKMPRMLVKQILFQPKT